MNKNAFMTFMLLTAIAILALVSVGCTESGESTNNSAAGNAAGTIAVRVRAPEYRTLEKKLSYVGTVFAGREVPISSRTQGTLEAQLVAEGAYFTSNTVLARLDAPELEAAVERLSAEAEYWTRRHETDRRLVDQGALAPEQADSSDRAARSARAALEEARAQLAKTVVTAPFDGQVLDWLAEPGQPLMPGQPLVLVGDAVREVRVDVVEEDLFRGISEGTEVSLELGTRGNVAGRVTNIASVSSGPARTFRVTIPVPENNTEINTAPPRKGASVRVHFILDRSETTPAVPARAITKRDGAPHIFVINDERAHLQPVKTGVSADGWTAVEFPWNGSDPVAVTNLSGLQDGVSVFAVVDDGGQ